MINSYTRCGFNAVTSAFIHAQGFESPLSLLLVTDEDLHTMIKNASRNPPPNVVFPFLAVKKLIAYRHWASERQRTGMATTPGTFTAAQVTAALTALRDEEERRLADHDLDPVKPEPLKQITGWSKFNEKWLNYIGQLRGRAHTPLTYVSREVAVVTAEIRAAEYDTTDERLIATTLHTGDHWEPDNRRYWKELKALCVDGAGWTYIKRFNNSENGRNAYNALKAQCEGNSVQHTRKVRAYNLIANARYHGERKTYNFQKYVEAHQSGFNEIFDVDEAESIPETKRVSDFLKGIKDDKLRSGIDAVIGNPTMLASFEATQQYLGTLVANRKEHLSTDTRDVSEAGRHKQRKLEAKWYPRDEWMDFTKEEQDEITRMLQASKAKRSAKAQKRQAAAAKKKKKRKIAKAKRAAARAEEDEDSDSSEDEPDRNDQAGNQFGRGAHKKKKAKTS